MQLKETNRMKKIPGLACVGMAMLALAAPPSSRADIYTTFFESIPGSQVSDLTNNPAFPNAPTTFEYPTVFKPLNAGNSTGGENHGSDYGTRTVGYFLPPETTNYNFYISARETAVLYLSTDDNPSNKVLIASEPNAPGNQDLNYLGTVNRNPTAPENRSTTLFPAGIPLVAGQKYYIEALHKDGPGFSIDVLGVQVEIFGGTNSLLPAVTNSIFNVDNAIPGIYLATALTEGPAAILVQPGPQTVVDGRRATFTARVDGTPPYALRLLKDGVTEVATGTFHTGSGFASIKTPLANLVTDNGHTYNIEVNGVLSSGAALTVTADTDVPTLVSVAGKSTLDGILVTFSEPVDPTTAQDITKYAITNQSGVTLAHSAAVVQADDKSVLLTTDPQTAGNQYCVVIKSGLKEAASAGKTVVAGSTACFSVGISITQQPQNVGAPEGGRATFSVAAVAPTPPVTYQWEQAPAVGAFADIPGATGQSYTHSPVLLADNGARFRCRLSATGVSDLTSGVGALSVIYADTQKPTLVAASATPGLAGVWVRFSEPVASASATLPSNYTIPGITVSAASLDASGTLVTLTTSSLTAGTPYTLHVTGVKDTSAAQNTILPDSQISFTATETGYAATVLADNPAVYLRFEESIGATTAANLGWLGAPANATYKPLTNATEDLGLVPPTYLGFSPANRAATFTGPGFGEERLTISEADVFAALATNVLKGSAQLTVEAWVKPISTGSRGTFVSQQGGNGFSWIWLGNIPGNTQFASGGNGFIGNFGYPFPQNTWHHLALVTDGTGARVYYDGVQAANGGGGNPASSSDQDVIIGGGGDVWSSGETVSLLTGQLDEVAIYRTALSGADLTRHVNAAKGNLPIGPNQINLITLSQGHVVINWNAPGTLQSAPAAAGTYVDVPGATAPPYATPLGAGPTFWRVRR